MILSTWLIFNVAGIGNLHYITNLIANSETIAPDKINEESNGEWVLKVQDFILEKRLEKKNPVDSEKKGIFKVVSDFIKSEYDAAPEFIQIILQILGFIIAVICVIVFILLWLFIDLSPLILVPITGILLLVPIYFLSSSVLVIFVKSTQTVNFLSVIRNSLNRTGTFSVNKETGEAIIANNDAEAAAAEDIAPPKHTRK